MTQSEVVNILNTFQEKFEVNKIEYRKKPVWPVLRYYLALVLLIPKVDKVTKQDDGNELNTGNSNTLKIKSNSFVKLAKIASVLKWPFLFFKVRKQIDEFLKLNANTLFVSPSFAPYPDNVEEKKYSRYIDPYFETFIKNSNAVKIQLTKPEQDFSNNFISTHQIREDFFLNKIKIEEDIKRIQSKKKDHQNFYIQLDALNKYAATNKIDYLFNTWLVDSLDEIAAYEILFKTLLGKSKVKQVFLVTYYSPCLFGLISACKKLKIKAIDIQHGVVDINYIGWNSIQKQTTHYLPDFYWVWSRSDFNFVKNQNSINCLEPVLGGNMWMGKFINETSKSINNLSGKISVGDYSKKIVVSLQYGEGFMNYMKNLMVSVIGKSSEKYLWMFRFHPLSSESEVSDFKEVFENYTDIDFEWATKSSLYEVFSVVDFHLVGSSAVALEGIQFNLPTIIVHELGADLFKDLIKQNTLCYALDANEILYQIENFKPTILNEEYQIKVSEQLAAESFESIILQ